MQTFHIHQPDQVDPKKRLSKVLNLNIIDFEINPKISLVYKDLTIKLKMIVKDAHSDRTYILVSGFDFDFLVNQNLKIHFKQEIHNAFVDGKYSKVYLFVRVLNEKTFNF